MFTIDSVSEIVTLLVALSIASERLVAIFKGFIPWLEEQNSDKKKDGRRKAVLHIMAIISGIFTAFFAKPIISDALGELYSHPFALLALGLLASGGSGFWNSFSSYILAVKNLRNQTKQTLKDLQKSSSPNITIHVGQ